MKNFFSHWRHYYPPVALGLIKRFSFLLRPSVELYLWSRYLSKKPRCKRQWQQARGKIGLTERPIGPCLWIHAVSMGELVSVAPLIEKITQDPTFQQKKAFVLVTTVTSSAARYCEKRFKPVASSVYHHYFPLDHISYIKRFLDFWQPTLAAFVESEIWPFMYQALQEREVPHFIINGRLSPKSYKSWQRFQGFFQYLLKNVRVICQDSLSAKRFEYLLERNVDVYGNLKFDAPAPLYHEETYLLLEKALKTPSGERRFVIVAGSFHPGEEKIFTPVFHQLCERIQDLFIILVPRHPEKTTDFLLRIQEETRLPDHVIAIRSKGQNPGPETKLYIADTFGELGLWYKLADLVLMGGTFIDHGGQNPIEAAHFAKPIYAGPSRYNFQQVFELFEAQGAVGSLQKPQDLVKALEDMRSKEKREYLGKKAQDVVQSQKGGLEKTLVCMVDAL